MRYSFMIQTSKILLVACFTSVIFLFVSCSSDESTSNFGQALEELERSYGSDPLQTYDLYLPADRSSASTDVIIMIHGGGWTSGDKEDVFPIVELLQAVMPDFAIANINYRLNIDPDDPFGDHMADVRSVVDDLIDRHEELGISTNIAMTGVSAGGHMALLYAYANNTNDYVKVVSNIIGPTFFLDPSYINPSNPTWLATIAAISNFTGVPLSDEAYYGALSPITFVDASTVPTIQFLGDEDPLIPTTQGTLLQSALDRVGVPNDLIIYEGEGHGWVEPENWNDTAFRFRDFVAQHM